MLGVGKGIENNDDNFSSNRGSCQHIKLNSEELRVGKIVPKIVCYLYTSLPNLKFGNKVSFKRHLVPFILQSGRYLN